MRNLAELDWRRGQAGETGLNLLNGIWTDIHERFRVGGEYVHRTNLSNERNTPERGQGSAESS